MLAPGRKRDAVGRNGVSIVTGGARVKPGGSAAPPGQTGHVEEIDRDRLGPIRRDLPRISVRGGEAHPMYGTERTPQPAPSDFSGLIRPTWEEIDQARMRYDASARRLRVWKWWFVGMFTFYTTLAGILLLRLFVG